MNSDRRIPSLPSADAWDHLAPYYDAVRQKDEVYVSCVRQTALCVPKGTGYCLDAGCGTGQATAILSERCKLVVAVDFSFGSLRVLRNRCLGNVVEVRADLTSLPFKTGVFEASVCANTLQHLQPGRPQKRAIAELRRVTKERGALSVSVHHYSKSKQKHGWVKEGRPGQEGIDYIYRFSREDLMRILPGSSIKGVGYYGLLRVPFLGRWLQDLVAKVLGGIAAILGYGHILVGNYRG